MTVDSQKTNFHLVALYPAIGRGKGMLPRPDPRNNSMPAGRAQWPCFLAPGAASVVR